VSRNRKKRQGEHGTSGSPLDAKGLTALGKKSESTLHRRIMGLLYWRESQKIANVDRKDTQLGEKEKGSEVSPTGGEAG